MALLCLIHATFHSLKNRENDQIYPSLPWKMSNKSDGFVLYIWDIKSPFTSYFSQVA